MTQKPTIRCDRCGADIRVTPVSDWEFEWQCLCGNRGVISWYHGAEPPTFQAVKQQELFDGTV